jgi:leucyl-tRNA synthetase
MEWTEAGVAGAHRFVQRLYRLAGAPGLSATTARPAQPGPAAVALQRATHQAIAAVTEALDTFAYNVAVARIHEFANAIGEAERQWEADPGAGLAWARRQAVLTLALLVAPMMPHLAEELQELVLGPGAPLVAEAAWPVFDPAMIQPATATIAVQVQGKLRGAIEVPADAAEDEVLAAAAREPNVARLLAGASVARRVYVPGRIVNFVLRG